MFDEKKGKLTYSLFEELVHVKFLTKVLNNSNTLHSTKLG